MQRSAARLNDGAMAGPSPSVLDAAVLEAIPDAVLVAGRDRRIVAANRVAHALLGHAPGTLPGQELVTVVPPTHRDRHQAHFDAWFENPRVRAFGPGSELRARR